MTINASGGEQRSGPGEPRAPRCPSRLSGRAPAAALLWSGLFFACLQAALTLLLQHGLPAVRDPEFGLRLSALKAQASRQPGRPLVLVLGSSRAAMGIRPGALPPVCTAAGRPVLVFNFSRAGAGPIMNLVTLHRLLDAGIHPAWVIVEFWPGTFNQEGPHAEEFRTDITPLAWRDLGLLSHYFSRGQGLYRQWYQAQLLPVSSYRGILLSQLAPNWLAWQTRQDHKWATLDAWGWLAGKPFVATEEFQNNVAKGKLDFAPRLGPNCLSGVSDKALREILALCDREGIRAALILMPESPTLRTWYRPGVHSQASRYVARLGRECGVPVLDTQSWSGDFDYQDGIHLLSGAAKAYTQRLGRELLGPLLAGKPCPTGPGRQAWASRVHRSGSGPHRSRW